MFPLETIRTRLAVDPKKYRNMLGAFQTIIEAEGASALYRVCLPVSVHGGYTTVGCDGVCRASVFNHLFLTLVHALSFSFLQASGLALSVQSLILMAP